jgi:hypothetical protein
MNGWKKKRDRRWNSLKCVDEWLESVRRNRVEGGSSSKDV